MKGSKKVVITVAVLVACTGFAVHIAIYSIHHHGHRSAYAASSEFSENSTPESALQALGRAAGKGDLQLLLSGMTPDLQKKLDGAGPEMESQVLRESCKLVGSKIVNKQVLSNNQVLLYVQMDDKEQPRKLLMQKMDDEWKFAAHLP